MKKHFSSLKEPEQGVIVNVEKHEVSLDAKESGVINRLSNRGVIMIAKDVLFVPYLRENLLSVKKQTNAAVEVLFNGGKVATLEKDGVDIAF